MKAGDRITAVDGTPVYTFGDLQHRYDQVPRTATTVRLTVDRGGAPVELTVALPARWWVYDLRWRQATVEPRIYFDARPLTAEEKRAQGLNPAGFASEVKRVDTFAEIMKTHELKAGDVITAVNGVDADPVADSADLYLRLRIKAGDSATLSVLRDGKKIEMPIRTYRMAFRK
jgi:S1-C subfamily serine protease